MSFLTEKIQPFLNSIIPSKEITRNAHIADLEQSEIGVLWDQIDKSNERQKRKVWVSIAGTVVLTGAGYIAEKQGYPVLADVMFGLVIPTTMLAVHSLYIRSKNEVQNRALSDETFLRYVEMKAASPSDEKVLRTQNKIGDDIQPPDLSIKFDKN